MRISKAGNGAWWVPHSKSSDNGLKRPTTEALSGLVALLQENAA